MIHRMNLNPQPFAMISCGRKTIELRLNDEKRQRIRVGDTIIFSNTADEAEQLTVRVVNLYRFADFAALYAALPLDKCGYLPEEVAAAKPEDMEAYYSAAQQAQYGVLGIALERADG